MSTFTSRLLPIVLFLSSTPSYALDARNPDPLSVVSAAFAAQNVGNVDAATAFYTPDAVIINSRGRTMQSVRWFHESNRGANVQVGLGANPRVDGNRVTMANTANISFFDQLGLGPVEVVAVITLEGNRIKSLVAYYPLKSVARIEQACRDHPEVTMFGGPCLGFADQSRAHTAHLIAEGIATQD